MLKLAVSLVGQRFIWTLLSKTYLLVFGRFKEDFFGFTIDLVNQLIGS